MLAITQLTCQVANHRYSVSTSDGRVDTDGEAGTKRQLPSIVIVAKDWYTQAPSPVPYLLGGGFVGAMYFYFSERSRVGVGLGSVGGRV